MRKIAAALALSVVLLSAPAQAQLDRSTVLVEGPPLSLAAPDSPLAVDLNPAALPYLPSWGLAYLHSDSVVGGDGVYFAMPLVFGAAAGLSIEHVRPEGRADRGVGSLALAFAPNAQWSA